MDDVKEMLKDARPETKYVVIAREQRQSRLPTDDIARLPTTTSIHFHAGLSISHIIQAPLESNDFMLLYYYFRVYSPCPYWSY